MLRTTRAAGGALVRGWTGERRGHVDYLKGLFIGAAVSGFACFLAAVIKILRVKFEYKRERETNN